MGRRRTLDMVLRVAYREKRSVYRVGMGYSLGPEGTLWADAESVQQAVAAAEGNMFRAGETLSAAYAARQGTAVPQPLVAESHA